MNIIVVILLGITLVLTIAGFFLPDEPKKKRTAEEILEDIRDNIHEFPFN